MLRRASGGIADSVGVRPGNRLPRQPTRDPQAGILGKLLAGATEPFEQMYGVSQGDYAPLGVEWVDGVGWVQSPEKAIPFAVGAAGLGTAGSLAAPAVKNATGMGIRAYHGSPHDFDRFSMDKIGTGEGAQAYGHGLYFAENPGVAGEYRKQLTRRDGGAKMVTSYDVGGKHIAQSSPDWPAADVAGIMRQHGIDPSTPDGMDWLDSELGARRMSGVINDTDAARAKVINFYKADDFKSETVPGRMYEVDINASPDEFLDWDKPLSEQPEKVRAVLEELGIHTGNRGQWTVTPSKTEGKWVLKNAWGEVAGIYKDKAKAESIAAANTRSHNAGGVGLAYTQLGGNHIYSRAGADRGAASAKLNAAGIKGIRYKDAGSRGTDSAGGTSNLVVFDDNIIEILRKYGIAGLTAGGAGAAMLGGSTQDASASQPTYTTGGRFAAGGRTLTMATGGIANAPKPAPGRGIAPPAPFMPGEERQLSHGLIKSDVPGRTDQLPITVPTDSYIIPADVISGLGQGNSDAGWPIFRQILAARGVSVPDDGSYDDGPGVDIIAAGGEGVVHPEVIRALGGGDMKKGHRILDDMVLSVRKQTAKRLSTLAPPKK